jgi:predicted nucleotidyltransferase
LLDSKGVDAEGFIRTISRGPIQPAFRSAADDLCGTLLDCLGSLIDSVYLYGSVARGDATAGTSDLDVTLILTREPTLQDDQAIESVRLSMEKQHNEVTKVDFDVGCLT